MFGRLWKVQAADYLVNLRVVFSMCGKISISRKTQIGRKRSTEVGFIEVTWHQLHTGGVGFLHPESNLAPKQENNWDQNFLFETAPSVKVVDMKKITRKPFYEFNLTLVKDAFLERQRPHLKLYSLVKDIVLTSRSSICYFLRSVTSTPRKVLYKGIGVCVYNNLLSARVEI